MIEKPDSILYAEIEILEDTIDRQQSCIRHRDEQHNTLVAIGLDKDATITELKAALRKIAASSNWMECIEISHAVLKISHAVGIQDMMAEVEES